MGRTNQKGRQKLNRACNCTVLLLLPNALPATPKSGFGAPFNVPSGFIEPRKPFDRIGVGIQLVANVGAKLELRVHSEAWSHLALFSALSYRETRRTSPRGVPA